MFGLSVQTQSGLPAPQPNPAPPQPDSQTLDPTFEPLEQARRAINEFLKGDERFPELDQLVQRSYTPINMLISRGSKYQL